MKIKMIIVLTLQGKGPDRAEAVATTIFEDRLLAERYCEKVTDSDKKYWVHARIVENGEFVDTMKPSEKMV